MKKEEFTNYIISFIHNPKNHIADTTEEVSDYLYYSKAMRVVCVIDEDFDNEIDGYLMAFYADSIGQRSCSEGYVSSYGVIKITQEETGKVTVAFAAEEEN